MLTVPKLYVIADPQVLAARAVGLQAFAEDLRAAGVSLVQLRDKQGTPQAILSRAACLKAVFGATACRLIMNDRADLAVLAEFDGVHVGQDDLAGADASRVLNAPSGQRQPGIISAIDTAKIVGISTHTGEQVQVANATAADYIAIGPVFATGTKLGASPVVGIEGVRRARALTAKPLVAIGGITRRNVGSVIAAGADSAAVISGLFVQGETVEKVARDFLDFFR